MALDDFFRNYIVSTSPRLYHSFQNDDRALYDPTTIRQVQIIDVDGSTVLETITTTIKESTGLYYVDVAAANVDAAGLYTDLWYMTPVTGQAEQQEMEVFSIITALTQSHTKALTSELRQLLKDNHPTPTRRRHTNFELETFLKNSLYTIDMTPPTRTAFSMDDWYTLAADLRPLMLEGAMLHAVAAQSLFEISKEFDYSDGGISININRSAKYQSWHNSIALQHVENVKSWKRQYFMDVIGPSVLIASDVGRKLRTYAPSQWRLR